MPREKAALPIISIHKASRPKKIAYSAVDSESLLDVSHNEILILALSTWELPRWRL